MNTFIWTKRRKYLDSVMRQMDQTRLERNNFRMDMKTDSAMPTSPWLFFYSSMNIIKKSMIFLLSYWYFQGKPPSASFSTYRWERWKGRVGDERWGKEDRVGERKRRKVLWVIHEWNLVPCPPLLLSVVCLILIDSLIIWIYGRWSSTIRKWHIWAISLNCFCHVYR